MDCELRCILCFKAHFPYRKFCRWTEKKNNRKLFVKIKQTYLSEDTINLVNKKMHYLQDGIKTMKDIHTKEIKDIFF